MNRLLMMGMMAALACGACVVSATAQDRPDRSLRLDHDSMRNDYREDLLKPVPPLFPEQKPLPSDASKSKAGSRRAREPVR